MNDNPIQEFDRWYKDAQKLGLRYPNAMALATVDPKGVPSVRIVLMKHFDDEGVVFYTNLTSHKSKDIKSHPTASVCFHWEGLGRQVRVTGQVTPVTDAEADAYFASRARESQLGAWASKQSETMQDRSEFEDRLKEFTKKFEGGEVPRPKGWSGWRIAPDEIEFWIERPYRLHDRFVFHRKGGQWTRQIIYP